MALVNDLEHFADAQAAIYDLAVAALRSGSLPAEWTALIFPPDGDTLFRATL